MKYVNTNVQCFECGTPGILGRSDFSHMISEVDSRKKDDFVTIGEFNVVVFINIRGTQSGNDLENPLDMGKKLKFLIRLTKVDTNEDNQLSYTLGEFDIDLSDMNIRQHACFPYVEQIQVLKIDNLLLKESGNYVIKVLVKEDGESFYDVQITHPLKVK